MALNTIVIPRSREDVFAVLADPYAYSEWVLGPRRIVAADGRFPKPGSAFVHEEGVGPIEAQDETVVLDAKRPSLVTLRAKLRPLGAIAHITIELDGSPDGTHVRMRERPVEGLWATIWNPLFDGALWVRNAFALRRLRDLVVRRSSDTLDASPP